MDLSVKGSTDIVKVHRMKKSIWIVLGLSVTAYIFIGYILSRQDFFLYISAYLILFSGYVYLIRKNAWQGQLLTRYTHLEGLSPDSAGILLNRRSDVKILIAASVFFRACFLFSQPTLSDDYFRFIWDGNMLGDGMNPYSILPASEIIFHRGDSYLGQLFAGMNSPGYYTIYPPVCQFIFAIAVKLFPGNIISSIVVMRIFCIAAEAGTIYYLQKILTHFNLPKRDVLFYALNPLIIIELSGNIHMESLMIFFMVLAVHGLIQFTEKKIETVEDDENPLQKNGYQKLIFSAISFAFAISSKLLPLIFLPFLLRRLKGKPVVIYFSTVVITCILFFLPFINGEQLMRLSSSLGLYFQKFEFNASIFYIVRWIGFQWRGYDVVQSAGFVLAMVTFVSVLFLAAREKVLSWRKFFFAMQWALTIYLLLSTTIHPWYITTLVMVSVVTGYQYPIVWSLFIALSYASYESVPYHENALFVAVEYVLVIGVLVWELTNNSKRKQVNRVHE